MKFQVAANFCVLVKQTKHINSFPNNTFALYSFASQNKIVINSTLKNEETNMANANTEASKLGLRVNDSLHSPSSNPHCSDILKRTWKRKSTK